MADVLPLCEHLSFDFPAMPARTLIGLMSSRFHRRGLGGRALNKKSLGRATGIAPSNTNIIRVERAECRPERRAMSSSSLRAPGGKRGLDSGPGGPLGMQCRTQ